jgi:hypothetical protein
MQDCAKVLQKRFAFWRNFRYDKGEFSGRQPAAHKTAQT